MHILISVYRIHDISRYLPVLKVHDGHENSSVAAPQSPIHHSPTIACDNRIAEIGTPDQFEDLPLPP